MSRLIPPAATLLQASADYLEHELLPTLAGYHRFQTRITVNVLRTLQRELELGPARDAAEHSRLVALLGHEGSLPALEAELAAAIAEGRIALDAPELTAHLRHSLRDALAIDNPKWAAPATPPPEP